VSKRRRSRGGASSGAKRGAGAKQRTEARTQSFEATVRELTPTGDGLAVLDDGRRAFIPGVVAGERVRIRLDPKSRTLRGRVDELIEPSPQRVEPPCPHARAWRSEPAGGEARTAVKQRCGGCDWMHVAETERRNNYTRMLIALLDYAGMTSVPQPILHTPVPALAYRSRARLQLRAHGKQTQVGYHSARSHRLAEVDSCSVLREELQPLLAELGPLVVGSEGTGEALLALGQGQRPVVELRWRGQLDAAVFARAHELVESDRWAGVQIWAEDAVAPASFGEVEPRAPGGDGQPLQFAPGGFAQASNEGSVALARRVAELVAVEEGKPQPQRIVELFAGSGTLSVMLVGLAERYVAVEQYEPAAAALRHNLKTRELTAKVLVADANSYVIPKPTECVVLDPPRAGAAGAMTMISKARPRRVVYVSCNPVTLARDLAGLADSGYVIDQLEQFELFPHTSHIETVARLVRTG
jgi:23S rRNA (uracil1939-C5)-methyltransferase